MKRKYIIILLCIFSTTIFAQNPIAPIGTYIADPSAHVWKDGKLYVYGSLDLSSKEYCSPFHDVLSTTDMLHWKLYKNVFRSSGENDQVPYCDTRLSAPDCYERNGRYYMYYCQHNPHNAEGVAISNSPTGPFIFSNILNVGQYQQIDPCAFIDDDGQAYYVWGQFSMKMAKMDASMTKLDEKSIKDNVLTEKEHFFHEGSYMTKHNGLYYIVYAHMGRGGRPTCLGYATSKKPMGPYKYGGVIIDNNYCDPGVWNNHGSIAEFKGQWYVFYHRSSFGTIFMRTACVEPITFNEDGSIDEVEMTSQGAGPSLQATSQLDTYRICQLNGSAHLELFGHNQIKLTKIRNEDTAAFRYVDFGTGVKSITVRVAPGVNGGKLNIGLDHSWEIGNLIQIEIPSKGVGEEWVEITVPIKKTVTGKHALWLNFSGYGDDLFELDWLKFNN